MEKKIIVHLLASNKYSGAENVALTIIKKVKKKSDEYEFYYVSPIGEIQDICIEKGVNYIPLKDFSISTIKKVIRKVKPNIIHAHDPTATVKAVLSSKDSKAIVISHLHNNNPIMRTKNLRSFLYFLCSKKVKYTLTVSESIMDEYVYASKAKNEVILIGNPIDFNEITKYTSKEKNIDLLFVGRLTKQKNPEQFINICEQLIREKGLDIKCVMIGDGELFKTTQAIINKRGLQKNIIMKGFLYQPYKEMAKARILLMTSDWEGYGLVAIESMITGTLVVAHKVGGLSSIINNDHGFLYEYKDSAVQEIEKLLSDDIYYEKKKNAIANYIKEFDNEKYCNEIIDIYNKALK